MSNAKLVRFTNILAIIAIVALVYWVFIFISTAVFDFKVFRENITEAFGLSILGLFAILFGTVILNVMLNLTRIAERDKESRDVTSILKKRWIFSFFFSFPLIFALLYYGDHRSKVKKEHFMLASAKALVKDNPEAMAKMNAYTLTRKGIDAIAKELKLLNKVETNLPSVRMILFETFEGKPYFFSLSSSDGYSAYGKRFDLSDYIRATTQPERDYLEAVFSGKRKEHRFSAYKNNYELFYPVISGTKIFVLYFSDYMRYGKMGS